MNVDPENFAALRKLLSIKRLEQPPPGYFDNLADKITWRLEMGEGRSSFWDLVIAAFSRRPALAYGVAFACCATIAGTTIYTLRADPADASESASVESWNPATPALAIQINPPRPLHVLSWTGKSELTGDTTPEPAHSLFQPVRMVTVPAAYSGGN